MKKQLCTFALSALALLSILSLSPNARATVPAPSATEPAPQPESILEQMNCELRNFIGFEIGNVEMSTSEPLVINFGLVSRELQFLKIQDNQIVTKDSSGIYNYIFLSNDPVNKRQRNYEGVLYQQYTKGLGQPQMPLALFKCRLNLK